VHDTARFTEFNGSGRYLTSDHPCLIRSRFEI